MPPLYKHFGIPAYRHIGNLPDIDMSARFRYRHIGDDSSINATLYKHSAYRHIGISAYVAKRRYAVLVEIV
jgi:hypothetical protein